MPLDGEYAPSPSEFVSGQVRRYEATGGREGADLQGKPTVILTTRGRRTGKIRKSPLMRIEHEGNYVVVASLGGAPKHPIWYLNLVENPAVTLQDGDRVLEFTARTATPDEKAEWWPRAVEVWPDFVGYQAKTEREIPVVILEPRT